MSILHFIGHWTGISDESGSGYALWSGIGSGSPLLAGIALVFRRHNCHQRWCWRIGRHPHGQYVLCSVHHPNVPDRGPTAEHIKEIA